MDAERQKFARTKINSRNLSGNKDDDPHREERRDNSGQHRTQDKTKKQQQDKQPEANFQIEDPLLISPGNRMTRTSSWADEVDENLNTRQEASSPNTVTEDRNQWTQPRRAPSTWAQKLNQDVNVAGNLAGRAKNTLSELLDVPPSRKMKKIHVCQQDKVKKIHHWFGDSTDDETSDDSTDENWTTIDREKRNYDRKRKSQDRKHRKKAELILKAKRMAGIGPITNQDIELQSNRTRNYSQAKSWAVKAHLAQHYHYNQSELDALEILETKRTNRDDIVYIATANKMDIKDIYSRKAECRSDNTVVKMFIPPQFYSRFSTINRICADRRSRDDSLKTQIRFGEKDFIVLTKEKGSQEPYLVEDLATFADGEEIPDIDLTIKWNFHEDRPPRRRVVSSQPSPSYHLSPAANGQTNTEHSSMDHPTRQLSSSKSEVNSSKRQRLANHSSGFPAKENDEDMDQTL